ncbi:hypothetical protein [Sunxiuqinia rutila]|uniref:hypothetical protein n=1 Tax=Sunxiuqinia rutila TaxID=1397841 RepID=UPI003D359D47
MDTQKIEQVFSMANKIAFHPTRNVQKEPSVVGLEFHKNLLGEAIDCYSNLKNELTHRDLVFTFKRIKNGIKASIISKAKGEVMSFRISQEKGMTEFAKETNPNHPFAFVILQPSNDGYHLVPDSNPYQPIVFDKYVLIE